MLKIGVLDDEPEYIVQIHRITEKYLTEKGIRFELHEYNHSERLLWAAEEKGNFDLFLLDIELDGGSGLETARKIRQLDSECAIVYITNYVDYAPAAFEHNAFRYILKRELEEKLPKMYDELCPKLLQKDERCYMVKTDSRMERIYYKDVLYIKKEKKYVVFHMKSGAQIQDRNTLDQVEQKLDGRDFVKIDKGCIINLNHLESVKKTECTMRDGAILGISQARCRMLKERVAELWDIQ